MKKLSAVFVLALVSTTLVAITPTQASAAPTLTTCTNLETGKTLVLQSTDAKCRTHLGSALWVQEKSDTPSRTGDGYATMTVCSSKNSLFTYQLIKDSCPKFQVSTNYWRTVATPSTPVIEAASARGHDSASLFITPLKSAPSAPVLYYLVTDIRSGEVRRVAPVIPGYVNVSGLSSESTYTFTIAAVSVDGISAASLATPSIRTSAAPVVVSTSAPVLAAPAFTISSTSETKTVNNAISGYTITSTGGTIASYSISPSAPAGLTFSTSTGLLSGTPTSIAAATVYTITAINASGSASRTFTLTVTEIVYSVGDTGPGGGIVFYVSAIPFTSAGSTCNTACKYLEAAPAGWNNDGVVTNDPLLVWSTNKTTLTGQSTSAGTESRFEYEKLNWKLGQGFYNTSVMRVSLATSTAQAAVLAYAGGGFAGQWFIPSMNELNELCKYAHGQATGTLTVGCTGSTPNKPGFVGNDYWSSSEVDGPRTWNLSFGGGTRSNSNKDTTLRIRPIRAF
jgi:hypothetical protein